MADVCAACFEDLNLVARIIAADGEPGCDYCGHNDAPTIDLNELGAFMLGRLELFYSYAEDILPFDRESDYGLAGPTYTTYEVLSDNLQLELPRDRDARLRTDLSDAVEANRIWTDYDPARVDEHEAIVDDWEVFCEMAKADFERVLAPDIGARLPWDDTRTPRELLYDIIRIVEQMGVVLTIAPEPRYRRARARELHESFTAPAALGPPLPQEATQPNRMNRPGDPLFYLSESAALAYRERDVEYASIGTFAVERPIRILDLVDLPPQPGIFSEATRDDIYGTRFLRFFARAVSQPIDIEGRNVADYAGTQAVTRFLRQNHVGGVPLDGIRYGSATGAPGANVVLFANRDDVIDAGGDPTAGWIRLIDARDEEAALADEQLAQAEEELRRVERARAAQLEDLPLFNQP